MKFLIILFIALIFVSCKSTSDTSKYQFGSIKIDTLLIENISIRAIAIAQDELFYAGDNNRVGTINLKTKKKRELEIKKGHQKFEFRSCAKTDNAFFALSIGNPALLYRIKTDLSAYELVYEEHHENVFYDSMQFYDNWHGIAIGDPIDGYLSIITTTNGGVTWKKNTTENSPKLVDGESFFAASNTNINLRNGKTWLVSGGKKSRIFYSDSTNIRWNIVESPIIQGQTMTGIFSADFYNDQIGIITGGNYDKPNDNFQNKAVTLDGGKTWKLVAENYGFGYSSCVQFIPESNGKKIVSVGLTGIYISTTMGEYWTKLSNDKSLFTIRFINKKTAIAAGKNKIIKITFQ